MIIISFNKLKRSKLKCDFKDDLFIEGITAYDNERHHFKIARKSFFVENGSLIEAAHEKRRIYSSSVTRQHIVQQTPIPN